MCAPRVGVRAGPGHAGKWHLIRWAGGMFTSIISQLISTFVSSTVSLNEGMLTIHSI